MAVKVAYRLQIVLKLAFLAVCLFVAIGGYYPTAYPQEHRRPLPVFPVITTEDAMQDHDIDSINEHLNATDARLQKELEAEQKNSLDISGIQGEERIIGSVLALLSSAGLILQVRRKPV